MGNKSKSSNSRPNFPTLDLHGERLDGLEDKVDRFITSSQRNGHEQIKIMTGKGSGQVRSAVQKYLKLGGYTFRYDVTPGGQKNEGILVVQI